MASLNVLTICGSLRKGSFNAMVQRALPALAPEGMTLKGAPSFAEFPLYNADIQNSTGFPAPVNTLADAIRAADGVIFCTPEYNFGIPGGLKNAIDWVSRLPNQPFAGKPVALISASPGPLGGGRVQYDMRRSMVFLDAYTLNKPEVFIGKGPYTAVREVALTRFDQGGKTERFEVGIGESDGKRFAPGDVPWTTAAVGHAASKFDEKTGAITDETTRGFIKQQLAAFAAFIQKLAPKK